MKIGIITYHHARKSYGACLQALALSRVCARYASTEIINFENPYEQREIKDIGVSLITKIRRRAVYLVKAFIYQSRKNPYSNISKLDSLYGCVSQRIFHSADEMNSIGYDVLITGSDQVWNPEITGGVEKAFLLDFGQASRRISYAASMGSHHLTEFEKDVYRNCLSRFSAISVREEFAKKELQGLTEKDIFVAADPTMLLNVNEWKSIFPELQETSSEGDYILTFFVTHGFSSYSEKVSSYADRLKLPIWNDQHHNKQYPHVDKIIQAPSISEFLSLIQNASLVITNSFHGTAFAIYFHKRFVSLVNKGNASRVENLLTRLNLVDRIDLPLSSVDKEIDYTEVDDVMEKIRCESKDWLKNAIITEK